MEKQKELEKEIELLKIRMASQETVTKIAMDNIDRAMHLVEKLISIVRMRESDITNNEAS